MRTILDYTKEIVDEIYKYDEHWAYTIVIEPNAVRLMEKDLYVPFAIMLSKMDSSSQTSTNSTLPTQHSKPSKKLLITFSVRKETYISGLRKPGVSTSG